MQPQHSTASNNQQQEKKPKNVFRFHKTSHFVTINYLPVHSPELSCVAKALWVFGISHPPDWTFYFSEIMKHFKEGERSLYNAFNELIKHGYASRLPYHMQMPNSKRWVFAGNEYVFYEKKMNETEIQEVQEQFKKCFQDRRFLHPQIEDAQNAPLQRSIVIQEQDSSIINAPSTDDAPIPSSSLPKQPKKPYKSVQLQEHCAYHPQAEAFKQSFNQPLIGISEEHHKELMIKYGLENTRRFYAYLAEWKLSKAQVSPKAVTSHSDYYRIKKWVIKEVLENPTALPVSYKRTGKLAIESDKNAMAKLQETGTSYVDAEDFARQITEANERKKQKVNDNQDNQ